jgi:LysM repeat protein
VKSLRITAFILVCVLAAVVLFAAPGGAHAQTGEVNLLVDGGFEAPPTWPQQDGIGEVQVAPGWRAWYLDMPPHYVQIPANCNERSDGYHCYWMRPEFRDNTSFENRIHSGVRSQKYFSYGRMHEAGLYQQVGGIKPGVTLRFAIYIQAWQCVNPDKCLFGRRSDAPAEMHLRVGIDPTGGTDPFSPNIVWSPEQAAFDKWVEFSVQAVARNDTVTVFTHSRADWDWARADNDVYLDDASLVILSGSAAQSQPVAQVTSNASAAFSAKQLLQRLKKYRSLKWHPDCNTPSCYDVDILGNSGILIPGKPIPASTPALAASSSVTPTVTAPITPTASSPAASTSVTPTVAAPITSTASSPAASTSVTPTVAAPITSTASSPAASSSVTPTVAASITSTASSPAAPRTYVVVEGDTLSLIAKRFNTTMEAIMQANQLTNPDFVWIGQVLSIP